MQSIRFPDGNVPEGFVYRFETEEHKFDKTKRMISNKTGYFSQRLKEVGVDLKLEKEDRIVVRTWNEEGNVSEGMRRLLKESLGTINRTLAGCEMELQLQEGLYKLIGTSAGMDSLDDSTLDEIKIAIDSLGKLESLVLSLTNCSRLSD